MEKLDGYRISLWFSDKIPIGKLESNNEIAICSLFLLMYLSFNFSFQNFARKADGSGSLQEFCLLKTLHLLIYKIWLVWDFLQKISGLLNFKAYFNLVT